MKMWSMLVVGMVLLGLSGTVGAQDCNYGDADRNLFVNANDYRAVRTISVWRIP